MSVGFIDTRSIAQLNVGKDNALIFFRQKRSRRCQKSETYDGNGSERNQSRRFQPA